ncbi:MAG: hypothetical protein AAFW60_10225 [Pseudomonadota bacterium]
MSKQQTGTSLSKLEQDLSGYMEPPTEYPSLMRRLAERSDESKTEKTIHISIPACNSD